LYAEPRCISDYNVGQLCMDGKLLSSIFLALLPGVRGMHQGAQ
jgi:hypothetical protein